MRKEELYQAFASVDDELLERTEAAGRGARRYWKWGALAACAAGMIVSIVKLRCPYCGKGAPRAPAFSPSSGKVQYCSGCGRPFVYDDEV